MCAGLVGLGILCPFVSVAGLRRENGGMGGRGERDCRLSGVDWENLGDFFPDAEAEMRL